MKKRTTYPLIVQNLGELVVRESLIPEKVKKSLKELLLAMPEGEDADFKRNPDRGWDVEL